MLSKGYGLEPDPWQSDVITDWLALDKYNEWAAMRCGLMVPRQNGKTGILISYELYCLVVLGEKILHTAHQQKTATEAFRELKTIFRNPDLAKLLDGDPLSALGREEIRLKNGGVIKYIARTNVSGLGFTADKLILDEAQEATDAQLEALLFAISAGPSGSPQVIMCGCAPRIDSPGEVFKRARKDAAIGRDKNLSWFEWSVENIDDVFDRSRWEDTNPALGRRIKGRTIENEVKTVSVDTFARQRLCWWPDNVAQALIDNKTWDKLATTNPATEGKLAYGIKFAPDGSTVSLSACIKPADGKPHIEVIEHRSLKNGSAWLEEFLTQQWKQASVIVIDGKSGAQGLMETLREAKVSAKVLCDPKVSGVTASSSRIFDAIIRGEITHFNQPALNEAACHAFKRPIGKDGGWGWGGIEGADVTPIESCALAYWGAMTTKRDPNRKQRIA